jgi:N6-adenosine-specific RNA methylase IME4
MGKQLVAFDREAVAIGALYTKTMIGSAYAYFELGQRLQVKKDSLGHGEWLPWLTDNAKALGFGDRTANKFMKFAKDNPTLASDLTEAQALQISRQIWGHADTDRSEYYKSKEGIGKGDTTTDLDSLAKRGERFGAIYADPPWDMGAGAEGHYDTMQLEDIKRMPIAKLASDDCLLFLWVTWSQLDVGIEVIKAWGFEYTSCAFDWVKINKNADPVCATVEDLYLGMGNWTRYGTEVCLLGTRGSPKRRSKSVRQVILAPIGRHSAKPLQIRGRIEMLVDGPYLELFARTVGDGWTAWGNEVPSLTDEEAAA